MQIGYYQSMTDGAGWSGLRGGNALLPRHWESVSLCLVSGMRRPSLPPLPSHLFPTSSLDSGGRELGWAASSLASQPAS